MKLSIFLNRCSFRNDFGIFPHFLHKKYIGDIFLGNVFIHLKDIKIKCVLDFRIITGKRLGTIKPCIRSIPNT